VILLVFSQTAYAAVCDVDGDHLIDLSDIRSITAARNTPAAGVDDPRDTDGNGIITVNDARACVLRCDLPRCAIVAPNTTPIANAGPDQQSVPGSVIVLDGGRSNDADDDALSFSWNLVSIPAESQTALLAADEVMPSLVPDLPGTYIAELVVNDGKTNSNPDSVVIEVPVPVIVFDNAVQTIQTLTPAGGIVRLEDPSGTNFMLEIPSDAIGADTEFRLTRVESISGLPRGMTPIAAVRLEPSGFDFLGSASLTVELAPTARTGAFAVGFLIDDSGENLVFVPLQGTTPIEAALRDLLVTINVPHFTGAGVLEAAGDAFFPPPPAPGPGADAQTIAHYKFAQRLWELDVLGTSPEPDDFVLVAAIQEWLADLQSRADALAISPDSSDLGSLRAITAEMSDLIENAKQYYDSDSLEAVELQAIEALSELTAVYLVELRDLCADDSSDAEAKLITLEGLVRNFPLDELEAAFVDETFACKYEVTFTPDFKAAFLGELVGFAYEIRAEDGTPVPGGFDDVDVEFGRGANKVIIESITPDTVIVRSEIIGLGELTAKVGNGDEAKAEVLSIPNFVGQYGLSYAGSAGGCADPEDAGNGSGAAAVGIGIQQILAANRNSATVGVAGGGGIVTGLTMTLTLDRFELGSASGSVSFGSADYRVVEIEDDEIFVTIGSGSLTGSVSGGVDGNTFGLDFNGGDNFCSNVSGAVLMAN
jgi:hypothetical protein